MKSMTVVAIAVTASLGLATASFAADERAKTDRSGASAGETGSSSARAAQAGQTGEAITTEMFFMKAAMGGMAEVELGELASQKGESADVKEFGQKMVADHTKANTELKALAEKNNVQLPARLDAEHQRVADQLEDMDGDAFDKAYAKQMVTDHAKTIALFEKGSRVDDREVAAFAEKTLPTLRQHAEHAERLDSEQ